MQLVPVTYYLVKHRRKDHSSGSSGGVRFGENCYFDPSAWEATSFIRVDKWGPTAQHSGT